MAPAVGPAVTVTAVARQCTQVCVAVEIGLRGGCAADRPVREMVLVRVP